MYFTYIFYNSIITPFSSRFIIKIINVATYLNLSLYAAYQNFRPSNHFLYSTVLDASSLRIGRKNWLVNNTIELCNISERACHQICSGHSCV